MKALTLISTVALLTGFSAFAQHSDCGHETSTAKELCKLETDNAIGKADAVSNGTAVAVAGTDMLQNTGDVSRFAIVDNMKRYNDANVKCQKAKDEAEKACQKAMADAQKRSDAAKASNDQTTMAREKLTAERINSNWNGARDSIRENQTTLRTGSSALQGPALGAAQVTQSR